MRDLRFASDLCVGPLAGRGIREIISEHIEAVRFTQLLSLNQKNNDERYRWARQSGLLATIPFLLAVPPIAGVFIGKWLDERIGTTPAFTIVFVILGFIAGVREVASVLKKDNLDSDNRKNKNSKQ